MFIVTTRCRVYSKRKWSHNARLLSKLHESSRFTLSNTYFPPFSSRKESKTVCHVIMVFFRLKFKKFQQFRARLGQSWRGKKEQNETEHPQFNLSAFFRFQRQTLLTFTPRFPSVSCVGLNLSQKNETFFKGQRDWKNSLWFRVGKGRWGVVKDWNFGKLEKCDLPNEWFVIVSVFVVFQQLNR